MPRSEAAGREDFRGQVAKVKDAATDAGLVGGAIDGAIADPKTPARVRAWLKRLKEGDAPEKGKS